MLPESVQGKKIIYGWDNREHVFLMTRENGEKKIHKVPNFEWYFCLTLEDYAKVKDGVIVKYMRFNVINRVERAGDFVRLYAVRKSDLFDSMLTDLKTLGATPLEADLSLTKRLMVDNHLELDENLRVGYFDIETDDRVDGITIGAYPILAWSIVADDGTVYYESSKNEEELLVKFLKTMDLFDVIVGWNSSKFDVPYIQARCEYHNFHERAKGKYQLYWKKTMRVDLMMRYVKLFAPIMSILNLSGFSLEEFSQVFLKRGKTPHTEKIWELFENNPEKLKEYNVNDCKLVKELNEHMRTLPLMIKECAWTGCFLDRFYVGELLDSYILRESKKQGKYLKTRPTAAEEARNRLRAIRGGYVKEPLVGFYDDVRVFDFKSMYPTIIIGHNIGEETLKKDTANETAKNFKEFLGKTRVEDVDFDQWVSFLLEQKKIYDPEDKYYQTAANQFFIKDHKSIISELIANLLQQRKQYKKALDSLQEGSVEFANARAAQEVVKELANSMFGITADASSRYYNQYISESITLTGQFWNRMSSKLFKEKFGLTTLYADTDSVFTVIHEDDKMEYYHEGINEQLNITVKEIFHLNPEKDLIDLEYEKKYCKLILLDKKRYIGRLVWSNGKTTSFIHSRGTENVKKDTISFTKKKLLELVEKLIDGMKQEEAVMFIEQLKEEVKTRPFEATEITITKKVSKPIAEYKTLTHHTRLAKRLIEQKKATDLDKATKISWGIRIKYILLDRKNKEAGAILADEYQGQFDRAYYWEVQVYSPLQRILKVVHPEINWESYEELFPKPPKVPKAPKAVKTKGATLFSMDDIAKRPKKARTPKVAKAPDDTKPQQSLFTAY